MPGSRIERLLKEHEELRAGGLNLVASENYLSPRVRAALASDLAGRYLDAGYGGSRHAREIAAAVEGLARKLFGAGHALVSSLSGNLCVLACLSAFTAPGDAVAMLPFDAGGYPFGLEKFHRRRVAIPADPRSLEIDAQAAVEIMAREGVRLAFLGASFIPFPHPVAEIRKGLEESGRECLLVYDGSHVLGLIACGEFQDPLREGADALIGSTHKTFFGPQGGLALTDDPRLADALRGMLELDLEAGIALVDNPHLNRIAALGLALEEIMEDITYGSRMVENARALAGALDRLGVPVRFRERGYTSSHQVLLDLEPPQAEKLCRDLEEAGAFIDRWGRLGTAEATHLGMGPGEMEAAAGLIAEVHAGRPGRELRARVAELALSFRSA